VPITFDTSMPKELSAAKTKRTRPTVEARIRETARLRAGALAGKRWRANRPDKTEASGRKANDNTSLLGLLRSGDDRQYTKLPKRKVIILIAAALTLDLDGPHLRFVAMPKTSGQSKKPKALLLGVGLDSDGHKRLTTGPNFALVGGSAETHEVMTEKAIKINEKLKAKGKQLTEVTPEEFDDIAQDVGLRRHEPKQN
jgi:hypothetical protein